jgi:mono/diheme cytochrome c family protein
MVADAGAARAALTLQPSSVTASAGASATVQISGARGEIQAESKNTAIVTVVLRKLTSSSATLTLKGVSPGSATVYVRDARTSSISLPVNVTGTTASNSWVYKLLATNDLGMHCVDADFTVFSILPPYNVVNAQVVRRASTGKPVVLNDATVSLRYEAVRDAAGSINSTSLGKSNFWDNAAKVYGANLKPGQGLKGLYMPKDAPNLAAHSFAWDAPGGLFKAEGVPILPKDDDGNTNRYPLMRVVATEKATGKDVATLDVVLPVSEETTCSDCHLSGGIAAKASSGPWSTAPDPEVQSRENILLLHDRMNGTQLMASKPVLCAGCHYSTALDLAGAGPQGAQVGKPTMSAAMHAYHGDKMVNSSGLVYLDTWVSLGGVPDPQTQACYTCHPGKNTRCLRGAMTESVNCQNCHGGMQAVGGATPLKAGGSIDGTNDGKPRRPWVDLPRCQSCHTGDAVNHAALDPSIVASDGLRAILAFSPGDDSASPRLASNTRFAENPGKLHRFSKGHSGIACEGCHNSTHAIWANPDEAHNDNVAAKELQGHSGTLAECSACHANGSLSLTLNGPHGMHNVGDSRWTTGHESFAKSNLKACAACHGTDYRGTALSKTSAIRTWRTEFGTRTVAKGQKVGCYDCHNGPNGD